MTDPSGWHRADATTPAAQARRRQYDSPEHRAARAKIKRQIAAGTAYCWRCGNWLPPGTKAHVGHDDHDRTIVRGAECEGCNLSAAASKGARVANARRKARKAAGLPAPSPAPVRRRAAAPPPVPVCEHHNDCPHPHSRAW